MALQWDTVQTEFAGDETTNFGPRQETGTALYQVETIATISTSNQTADKVHSLASAAVDELVCVAVNCSISIFRDSTFVVTLSFDNAVDDVAWSPDGSLLLVVDSSGKLRIFTSQPFHAFFTTNLVPGSRAGKRAFHRVAFRSDEDKKSCDLIVLSATGVLFIVKDFNPSAFTQDGIDVASVVKEQLQFRKVETQNVHTNVTWDALSLGQGTAITVGGGDSVLGVWKWQDNCISLDDSVGDIFDSDKAIISAKMTTNNTLLYCLDDTNQVSLWHLPSLMIVVCVGDSGGLGTSSLVSDFLLLETQGTQAHRVEGIKLVLLMSDELNSTLQIRNVDTGADIYNLQLGQRTALTKCAPQQESLFVAEGTSVLGAKDKVSSVRLRSLTETDPETRLQRIIFKKRFSEALNFAKLFNLDTELVYTAQLNQVLEQLSPWNVLCYEDHQVAAMLDELWTSVSNVKDAQLLAENCMRAALPSLADTSRLLKLCEKKMKTAAAQESEKMQALHPKLTGLQNRLITYKMVYGDMAYCAESWLKFQQANLLHLACTELALEQPLSALLVWRRHSGEWGGQVSVQVIQQLLQVLGRGLSVDEIEGWLNDDLLPYIATSLPKAMGVVIQWVVEKVKLEMVDKDGWPHNAITFLERLSHTLTSLTEVNFTASNDNAAEMASKTEIEVHSVMSPLQATLTMLRKLRDLLKYNLRLSIDQYQRETCETLAFRMLDQVVLVELLRPTLEKYITPYIRDHGLKQNHIFASYIRDLLKRLGEVRTYMGKSAWEEKVLTIISFITDPKDKCCAVLNVIGHAPLPWSPDIQQLVEEGLNIKHPLVLELKKAKKSVEVRQLMQKYQLNTGSTPSQSQAEKLAMVIAEKALPSSLADAQRVLKEFNLSSPETLCEVLIKYYITIIMQDRVQEYFQALQGLDWAQGRVVAERVVSRTEAHWDRSIPHPAVKQILEENNKRLMRAAILSLKYMIPQITDVVQLDELNIKLKTFSNLMTLQRNYDLTLTVSQYNDKDYRRSVLAGFTQQFLKTHKPFQQQHGADLTEIYMLADLLQITREAFQGELAVVEARAGNWNAVIFLCRELLKALPSPEVAGVMYHTLNALLPMLAPSLTTDCDDDGGGGGGGDGSGSSSSSKYQYCRMLPVVLEKMANQAVIMCSPDLLMRCLELSKWTRLWRQVGEQCEATETTVVSLMDPVEERRLVPKDPLQFWSLDKVYMDENALVMNSSLAMPLAAGAVASTSVFLQDDEEEENVPSGSVHEVVGSLQPLITHLKDNNHLTLALRFQMTATTSLRQYLTRYNNGFPLCEQVGTWLGAQQQALEDMEKRSVQQRNMLISSVAHKALSSHSVDHQMALSFLLSAPRKVSMDTLMKSIAACNFNFKKLGVIASVGQALGKLYGEQNLINTCTTLQTNASWGVRLGKLKISFKEAFHGGLSTKHDIITAMAACEKVNVRMVVDFAQDFQMEEADGLLLFLEALLKGRPLPQPWQLTRARSVVTAVEKMNRTDYLLKKLRHIYKMTSPYDYEIIEFLLEELNRLDTNPVYEKGLKVVFRLKHYTRLNPPSEAEIARIRGTSECKEQCGDVGDCLPERSAHRIPVHPLLEDEPLKIIRPELDFENVAQWLRIAEILELSVDEIHILTVQNIVHQHMSHTTSTPAGTPRAKPTSPQSWQVSQASQLMLDNVQQLLKCVKNCQMALACANWVIRNLPMGGDRVLGLQRSVMFAEQWYLTCDDKDPQKEKARLSREKFKKVLRNVLTEQALCINNLAEPQLMQLVASPEDLISALCEHPAVVADSSQAAPAAEVFSAVEKVCEVNDLDLGQELVTVMTKWLLASDNSAEFETTMNLSFSNLKMTEEALETSHNDNIKKVLYFLYRGPRPLMLKFLIDFVQTGELDNMSQVGRRNSLYCLLQISRDDDLQPIGLSCHQLREMLRVSCYLTQLEELHIPHSVQTLTECSKIGLVKKIWRTHHTHKAAVRLAAALCVDYKLYDRKQWAAMLQQMVSKQMFIEMEHVLQRLHSVSSLWSLPVFPTAWQAVITNAISKVSLPLTEEQTKSCLHTFNLLQSCPVLGRLDLSSIRHQYQDLGLDVCAVGCLLLDSSVSHSDVQEALFQDPAGLIDQSYTLTKQGLNLPSAAQVRQAVYGQVVSQGDYEHISQQALPEFINFLILNNQIDDCLVYALNNNMLPQAEMLIHLYFQRYPEYYQELQEWCDNTGVTPESDLQAYLHMRNLI